MWLRMALREDGNRASWIEQNLAGRWLSQVQVDNAVDFQPEFADGSSRVRYKAKARSFGRQEHGVWVLGFAPDTSYVSRLAPLAHRTLPVVVPYHLAPSQSVRTVRIKPPPAMKPGPLTAREVVDGGDFGNATYQAIVDPKDNRTVLITTRITFDLDQIPVARYEAWRTWLGRVDALQRRTIRFLPETGNQGRK
jgi:hypothetical protein